MAYSCSCCDPKKPMDLCDLVILMSVEEDEDVDQDNIREYLICSKCAGSEPYLHAILFMVELMTGEVAKQSDQEISRRIDIETNLLLKNKDILLNKIETLSVRLKESFINLEHPRIQEDLINEIFYQRKELEKLRTRIHRVANAHLDPDRVVMKKVAVKKENVRKSFDWNKINVNPMASTFSKEKLLEMLGTTEHDDCSKVIHLLKEVNLHKDQIENVMRRKKWIGNQSTEIQDFTRAIKAHLSLGEITFDGSLLTVELYNGWDREAIVTISSWQPIARGVYFEYPGREDKVEDEKNVGHQRDLTRNQPFTVSPDSRSILEGHFENARSTLLEWRQRFSDGFFPFVCLNIDWIGGKRPDSVRILCIRLHWNEERESWTPVISTSFPVDHRRVQQSKLFNILYPDYPVEFASFSCLYDDSYFI